MSNYNTIIPKELKAKLIRYGVQGIQVNGLYTYANIFDWFAENKHIIITLEPFFTFSLGGFIGYTWKISQLSLNQAKLNIIQEEDRWTPDKGLGGSFGLTADAAIEYAMTLKDEETHYVDMDVNDL